MRTNPPVTHYHVMGQRLQNVQVLMLLHAAMGMVTEAAELIDNIKKHVVYGKPLDWVNAAEEIGDSGWYHCLGAQAVGEVLPGVHLDTIYANNVDKLRQRFPDKFSELNAQSRDLEAERKVLDEILSATNSPVNPNEAAQVHAADVDRHAAAVHDTARPKQAITDTFRGR